MSKGISRKKIRDLAFTLRCEAMDACMESHAVSDQDSPRKKASLKEKGETKLSVAVRLEQMLDGEVTI